MIIMANGHERAAMFRSGSDTRRAQLNCDTVANGAVHLEIVPLIVSEYNGQRGRDRPRSLYVQHVAAARIRTSRILSICK